MYLLGRSFTAESDHKLLEMIVMDNLANTPNCLQRMILELQKFNMTIKYRPGAQMQLTDALSYCLARASPEIKLDVRVIYIAFTKPWIEKLRHRETLSWEQWLFGRLRPLDAFLAFLCVVLDVSIDSWPVHVLLCILLYLGSGEMTFM